MRTPAELLFTRRKTRPFSLIAQRRCQKTYQRKTNANGKSSYDKFGLPQTISVSEVLGIESDD
jgi:hypothetical protein